MASPSLSHCPYDSIGLELTSILSDYMIKKMFYFFQVKIVIFQSQIFVIFVIYNFSFQSH